VQTARQQFLRCPEDESYQLEILPTQARLVAPTVIGAMRGLETLLQLLGTEIEKAFFQAVRSGTHHVSPGVVC
jgi:hexosaminidase